MPVDLLQTQHVVTELCYQLQGRDEESVRLMKDRMIAGHESHLLPALDSALSELCSAEQVIMIDSVAVDLGVVRLDTESSELSKTLYKKVVDALSGARSLEPELSNGGKPLTARLSCDSRISCVSLDERDALMIDSYLATGCLTWSVGIDEFTQRIRQKSLSELATLTDRLQNRLREIATARRFVLLLGPELSLQLLEHIAPVPAQVARVLSERIISRLGATDAIAKPIRSETLAASYREYGCGFSPSDSSLSLLRAVEHALSITLPEASRDELLASLNVAVGARGAAKEVTTDVKLRPYAGHSLVRQADGRDAAEQKIVALNAESLSAVGICNSGLVILWPFLQTFFRQCDLLVDHCSLRPEAPGKAVNLLHILSHGEGAETEMELVLDKVLCGLKPEDEVLPHMALPEEWADEADSLLQAVIRNWSALGNTSVLGLRESFLKRPGYLKEGTEAMELRVEGSGIDVLLERLPWPVSVVALPWMQIPLQVIW